MLTPTLYPSVFRNSVRGWDPFRELREAQEEANRLLERGWRPRSTEYPLLNVWSNQDGIVVQAELPGFNLDDIDISVVQNILTLRGGRKPESLKEGENFHRRERWTGQFVRTLELPFEVDTSKVEAEYQNGLLSVRLPRTEEHKPKKISIKAS